MSGTCTRSVRFEFRNRSAAWWLVNNPVLLPGEPGVESDTGQLKIGNGSTPWALLPYVGGGVEGGRTGPTGPTGPVAPSIGFDGGNAASDYSIVGPKFDCGTAE